MKLTFSETLAATHIHLNSAANRAAAREVQHRPTIKMKRAEQFVLASVCAAEVCK